jgi:hypothetical protein
MSTYVNFSNSWPESLNWKHPISKNYKDYFLTNQMSKSEIEKKNQLYKKIQNK